MSEVSWSLSLSTPLGADALILQSFDGVEGISQPFHFTCLAACGLAYVDPAALLGKAAEVTLKGGDGIARPFHGVVTRMVQGSSQVTLEMRPWLWLLTLSRDHRIFQTLSVPEILAKVFASYPMAEVRNDLVLSYPKVDYCVQYGESDFDFVSRLMEAAGIAYWFEHKADRHTLVLVDDPGKFPACPNAASVPWSAIGGGGEWLQDARIETADLEQALTPDGFKTTDYSFITPATDMLSTQGRGQVYEYPGGYAQKADAATVSKRRDEELAAHALILRGASPLRHLAAGTHFALKNHPAEAFNKTYVLLSLHHSAQRRHYSNAFSAFPSTVSYRPPRVTPWPRIAGSQTAMVVGPEGKEAWTDAYGRVKLQFHWDQLGKSDADSSCWVRVSQSWSGKSWGAFSLPRVGQEVVVSFLDGDPDRPLVTGCVYNGDNPVPYALPDNQSRTTLKSQSTPNAAGFNELRFEDKAGEEEVFLQAQKDLNITVLNSSTETVKQDRAVTVQEGNDTFTVSNGDWTTSVATGNATHGVKGNSAQTVEGNLTIQVKGDVTIKADGAVTIESGQALTVKGGTTVAIEAASALTLKGATVELTASASGAIDGGGVLNLKGGMVKLN